MVKTHLVLQVQACIPDLKTTIKLERGFVLQRSKNKRFGKYVWREALSCPTDVCWPDYIYQVASSVALFILGPLTWGWACLCSIWGSGPLLHWSFSKGFSCGWQITLRKLIFSLQGYVQLKLLEWHGSIWAHASITGLYSFRTWCP